MSRANKPQAEVASKRLELSDKDIERLAESVVKKLEGRAFHLSDEDHYNEHRDLSKLLRSMDKVKGTVAKTFAALVIAGLVYIAALGTGR